MDEQYQILAFFPLLATLFWTTLGSLAISFVIAALNKTKTPKIEDAEPGQFEAPTSNEGVPFPVVFGTPKRHDKALVAWWGDMKLEAILRSTRVKDNWYSRSRRVYQTIGHRYRVGMEIILCHGPIDGIKQMLMGETVIWPDSSDPTVLAADGRTQTDIIAYNLFGGDEAEGGVEGHIDIAYGATAQAVNAYLVTQQGSDISARRGLTSVIWNQLYIGTSPYPKTPSFLLKRTDILDDGSAQWYSGKSDINGDLNPAHFLREAFSNTRWGRGYSTSLMQDSVWQACADTLYTEGFGLSKLWSSPNENKDDLINDVLRHIDATVYQEPTTGDIVLKLIRDDYVLANLESFDGDDILELSDFTRPSLGEIPDMYTLKYTDVLNNKTAQLTTHDSSLINMQGGKIIPAEFEFLSITQGSTAQKVLAREQNVIASMLASMKIKCKRTMAHLLPGDVFKLTWSPLGLTDMVVRILPDAKYGTLTDGSVHFQIVQDVFSVGTALYGVWPGSRWTSPNVPPENVTVQMLMEATFWDAVGRMGTSLAASLLDDAGFLAAAASAPNPAALDYEFLSRSGTQSSSATPEPFLSDGRNGFSFTDTISTALALNAQTATIYLDNLDARTVRVGSYCVIGNELLKVIAAGNQSVRLARGVIDTVPEAHSIGDRIWFIDHDGFYGGREFAFNQTPEAKYLVNTASGRLTEAQATTFSSPTLDARQTRPYPPGDVTFNGSSYPTTPIAGGDLTIAWAHRDRIQQTSYLVEHDEADIGPETGVSYKIEFYNSSDVLVRTVLNITVNSYVYTAAMQATDGVTTGNLRVKLYSVRSGYTGNSAGGRLP